MDAATITLLLSVAGAAVSLFGAYLAVKSGALAQRGLRSGAYDLMNRLAIDGDRLFVDYPALRPYFYDGRELGDADPLADQVMAAAVFSLDCLDAIWDQSRELDPADRVTWREWIHDLLERAPAMRAYLLANQPSYATLHGMLHTQPCDHAEVHRWVVAQARPA